MCKAEVVHWEKAETLKHKHISNKERGGQGREQNRDTDGSRKTPSNA